MAFNKLTESDFEGEGEQQKTIAYENLQEG